MLWPQDALCIHQEIDKEIDDDKERAGTSPRGDSSRFRLELQEAFHLGDYPHECALLRFEPQQDTVYTSPNHNKTDFQSFHLD